MNPIVFAIPIFMLSILLEAWLCYRRRNGAYNISDAITSLHLGVLSQVSGAFLHLFGVGIYAAVFAYFGATSWSLDNLWVWLLALLLYDFCYYWVHRFGHEVNLMWAAHQVHHSSEYFNLSTALRQSSTTALWAWPFYLPMAVLGVPPLMFVGVAMIDLLYQYWVHTELIGKLGWFDRVFVSPSNHRVHHGQNDYCIDKNYGGILIIWDRLFGSFVDERADEKIVYGMRTPLASYDPIYGNLNVYHDLWQQSKTLPRWRDKIAHWFAPPSGWGNPLPHLDTAQCQQFDLRTSSSLQWYGVLHYGLMVAYATHFIAQAEMFSSAQKNAYALLITLAAFSLAALLQRRPLAIRIEQGRLLLFMMLLLPAEWFGWPLHWSLRLLGIGMLAASSWWLQQRASKRLW